MHETLTLPLTNPVFIFTLVLLIILFIPILLNKLKIPHIVGLILAGSVIGPYGFNIVTRDASVVLFGTVGILYLMFLAGLEMDLQDFKKQKRKSIVFGLYTFAIPMIIGTLSSYYYLGFSLITSVLLASMYASHTLIGYPILQKLGITKNSAINITVGGTIITDVLALLVLAVIVAMVKGNIGLMFWLQLVVSLTVFMFIILYLIPIITKQFLKNESDEIARYIYVLFIVFVSAVLAMVAGVEPIIGAFLAGLSVNKFIPRNSSLMNRIEFIGNAIFIPYFLLGIGMIINFKILFLGPETLKIAAVMTFIATLGKWSAARLTQYTFKLSKNDGLMIFGLSNGQAAATLAAVVVGYNIILGTDANGEAIRLLSEEVLNGTIIMIIITCSTASFATYKAAMQLTGGKLEPIAKEPIKFSKFLIPVSNPATLPFLLEIGMSVMNKKKGDQLFAISVISDSEDNEEKLANGQKLLNEAMKIGAASNVPIEPLIRFDLNIANGIVYTMREAEITDLIIGLHNRMSFTDSFFGNLTESILSNSKQALYIYKPIIPLAVVENLVIIFPENAEFEPGFYKILRQLAVFKKNKQTNAIIYAYENTAKVLESYKLKNSNLDFSIMPFTTWGELLNDTNAIKTNDLILAVSARKNTISYSEHIELIPRVLNMYNHNSILIIYPEQTDSAIMGSHTTEILFDENFADQGRILYKFGSYMNRFLKK